MSATVGRVGGAASVVDVGTPTGPGGGGGGTVVVGLTTPTGPGGGGATPCGTAAAPTVVPATSAVTVAANAADTNRRWMERERGEPVV